MSDVNRKGSCFCFPILDGCKECLALGTSRSISISGFYMTEKLQGKKSVKTSKGRQTGQSEGRFRRCRPLKKSDKKRKWSLVSKTKDGEQNDWKTTPHTKHETQNEPRGARNFVAQRR